MTLPEAPKPILQNYFLLFRTYHGALLGWCVRSGLAADEVPAHIETAAQEWLLSPPGREFVREEALEEWGFDYAHALMNVPAEMLAEHGIYLWTPIAEILELEPDENLLPEELKKV
jgi:hypothetical protein